MNRSKKFLTFYKSSPILIPMSNKINIQYADDTFFHSYVDDRELDDAALLEEIFGEWNSGSEQECEIFLANRHIRSLSVADFVKIGDQWYQCASFGWDEVSDQFVSDWMAALSAEREFHGPTYTFEDERMVKWAVARTVKERLMADAF